MSPDNVRSGQVAKPGVLGDITNASPQRAGAWVAKTDIDYDAYMQDVTKSLEATGLESTWASSAPTYQWKEEYGDLAPRDEDLERELFGPDALLRQGLDFSKLVQPNSPSPFLFANSHQDSGR
jgi:hypothetical protein